MRMPENNEDAGIDEAKVVVSNVRDRLLHVLDKQNNVLERLLSLRNSLEEHSLEELSNYIEDVDKKLELMNSVTLRMKSLRARSILTQERLNSIRGRLPFQEKALVEKGPFAFKCIYRWGMRFRSYPSSSSQILPDVQVDFHEVITAIERVFILGDKTVYLHVEGRGWLTENMEDLLCFARC